MVVSAIRVSCILSKGPIVPVYKVKFNSESPISNRYGYKQQFNSTEHPSQTPKYICSDNCGNAVTRCLTQQRGLTTAIIVFITFRVISFFLSKFIHYLQL